MRLWLSQTELNEKLKSPVLITDRLFILSVERFQPLIFTFFKRRIVLLDDLTSPPRKCYFMYEIKLGSHRSQNLDPC